jgi:uncharacterized membrane protein (DUF2068 family)
LNAEHRNDLHNFNPRPQAQMSEFRKPAEKSHAQPSSRSRILLRTIAAFKFVKALLLVIAGAGVLHLVHRDVASLAEDLVERFNLDPGKPYVAHAVERVSNLTPKQLHEIGIVAFIYAGLFLLEGIGLWSLKRWGEWITVVITSSLLPVEIYESVHHATLLRVGVLLMNAAIVVYLIWRIRHADASGAH